MSSITEEIKSRINIVDIIGKYLKLEGAGSNYKARCPFHNENTPSFFVSPSRQTYHCFGCNRGGDVFSFVEEIEGLDFSGALKILAEQAGIELTREPKKEKDTREEIYRALDLASKFYEAVLPKFPRATSYIKERGITTQTVKNFRIGFAPDEWRATSDFLMNKGGVTENTLERAGLIIRSPKGVYDRFRGRIMFPITDSGGRVIAFSGRILDEQKGKTVGTTVPAKDASFRGAGLAKYVNSPETEIFHKSRALFGFYQAREAIRRLDSVVIVEGQIDLILSHQAGVQNTVASSGTALTVEHIALIKRFTKNIILAFDADDAGITAVQKGILLALSQDMSVRVVGLPHKMDPAEMVKKDPELWKKEVSEARHVIDFYLELLPKRYTDKNILRSKISEMIIPFVSELKSMLDQGHFVGQVAKILNMREDPIWEEVRKHGTGVSQNERVREKNKDDDIPLLSRRARIMRIIEGTLLWQEGLPSPGVTNGEKYRALLEKFREGEKEQKRTPQECDILIFEAETRWQGTQGTLQKELDELFKTLKEETIRNQFIKKMGQLKQAERDNDLEEAQKLLAECQEISKKLHSF
ncbi:MAG: toprim domain-containing protein [Candidatus Yonathbacteria bacterium]|nr:toprim domain-containing protein [Candidatus Yonathbacteria bacterium]